MRLSFSMQYFHSWFFISFFSSSLWNYRVQKQNRKNCTYLVKAPFSTKPMEEIRWDFNTMLPRDGNSSPPNISSVGCPWPWEREDKVGLWIFWPSISWFNLWRNDETEARKIKHHSIVKHSSKKCTLETYQNPSSIGEIHWFPLKISLPCYGPGTPGKGKGEAESSLFFCCLLLREIVFRRGGNSHDRLRVSWKWIDSSSWTPKKSWRPNHLICSEMMTIFRPHCLWPSVTRYHFTDKCALILCKVNPKNFFCSLPAVTSSDQVTNSPFQVFWCLRRC